jgi:hypothetical protein
LDEDGLCPSKAGTQTCWVPKDAIRLTGASARLQADLDAFLAYHVQGYFSMVRRVLNAQAPGVLYMGPTYLGTWGTPSRRQIYQAATQYLDVFNLGGIPPHCTNCTDIQARVDFVAQYGGDKPWINWEGFIANPDSYESPYSPGSNENFPTQGARGQRYSQMMSDMLNAKDTGSSTYHIVGIKWWELYDNRGLKADYGLLTRRDNPYDGHSATMTSGMDSWGYPTGCLATYGCEQVNYGNFLESVTNANLNAFDTIASGN